MACTRGHNLPPPAHLQDAAPLGAASALAATVMPKSSPRQQESDGEQCHAAELRSPMYDEPRRRRGGFGGGGGGSSGEEPAVAGSKDTCA